MVKIAGTATHTKRLRDGVGPNGIAIIGTYLKRAADQVAVKAQNLVDEGSTSSPHVASLPGQPPNTEFSTLVNNIESVLENPVKAVVSSNAPYASFLEFGTSKMRPRPYMAPALESERKAVVQYILTGINRANKTSG